MYVAHANEGSEQTIVFLHGANAGGWMWQQVIQSLPDFHCVALDMPGHGYSNEIEWVSPEETADQVAQDIKNHAHDGVAHVVGLSLGGYVTLLLLDRAPNAVANVIISGIPSDGMPNKRLTRIVGTLVTPFIHTDWLLRASAKANRIPHADLDDYVAQAKRNSKQAFRRINHQAVSFIPPATALATSHRKLFIAGSREHPAVRAALRKFAADANHAVCAEIPGLGHAWSAENPGLFAAMVRAWLTQQTLPDALQVIPN